MTLLTEIQAAQSLLIRPFVTKPLLIRTPLAIASELNPNNYNLWFFDPTNYGDSGDYVYLRLWPKYEADDKPTGDRGYYPTFNGTAMRYSTIRREFTATVNQSQAFVYRIVERLALIANTSSPHAPIKIIDFCSPEVGAATYTDGEASIRYGRVDVEKRPTMVRGVQMDYCIDGWSFRFSEASLRS